MKFVWKRASAGREFMEIVCAMIVVNCAVFLSFYIIERFML